MNVVTSHEGHSIPRMLYGTAWKKENTTPLVKEAIRAGFIGIDTACQPKHYREDLVGEALSDLYQEGYKREDLFLQTKFTPTSGQDPHNMPYDPALDLEHQVQVSLSKSLSNLKTTYLDSLLLHSPYSSYSKTLRVWRVFESFHKEKKVRMIGISNLYDPPLLKQLWEDALVKPSVIQNRFYEKSNYDPEIRAFCLEKKMWYQSFWTLTANPHFLESEVVRAVQERTGKSPEQVVFRILMKLGILPLSGTTQRAHMLQDVQVSHLQFDVTPEEVEVFCQENQIAH
uniref:NADP-dependent oxidoreductase domain-containing protein n=1 Tax=Arcella intermedia TaxID=1963864 RepID=A0A6B2LCH1_9EUKA